MDIETKEKVSTKFADRILETTTQCDQLGFVVDKSHLHELIRFLRDEPSLNYKHLSDITATDWLDRAKRFEIVYHLYSMPLREYVRVKILVGEDEPVPTMCTDWDCANWLEREVFDMFGVTFSGHPDLRRILMWDEFEGHPLRKDYPLTYEVPQFTFNKDEPPEVIK